MDLQKTGVCIAQCRKARRLTRSQLTTRLVGNAGEC